MLAITPMMLALGSGGSLQVPLAIAVFGGLLTSTVLTLIVIPVVYELIDDARSWAMARVASSATSHRAAAAARAPLPAPAGYLHDAAAPVIAVDRSGD
jgi:hydrophobic/amphiphilic exporter-1 (mainly G- bacteria), HAE1 family